jgi:multisubunit Na+/H+ antiporter MnhC subunit
MRTEAQLLMLDRDAVAARMTTDIIGRAVQDAFLLHSARQGRVFPVARESSVNIKESVGTPICHHPSLTGFIVSTHFHCESKQ